MSPKSTDKKRTVISRKKAKRVQSLESLESRRLLSASTTVIEPLLLIAPDASSGSVQGYTPAQIAAAYGFNSITLGGGIKGTGAGQTIGIVDAYNDPNIYSDLGVFDSEFGLPAPPSFKIVSQTGSTSALPATNASWATEISLDVEWAHAMAPGANIVLVETNSDSLSDLLAGVQYAAGAQGVSVVSMSWGGSEFSGENSDNSDFVTPTGHRGVTFVAASGDEGSNDGPEWPASSAYVLSVGGTTLDLSSSNAISNETAWSDSTGGASLVEGRPEYQNSVQSSDSRTGPDVAYDANPNTGVAVYDSLNYQGYVGWQEVGGTSEGAPQWAALIAIADQGRAAAGSGALNGSTQTLPDLYALYNNSTTYADTFNDITSGSSGLLSAAKGYDQVTGLGSPRASAIVQVLIGDGTMSVALTTTTVATTSGGGRARGRFDVEADPAAATSTMFQQNDAFGNASHSSAITTILAGPRDFSFAANSELSPSTAVENTSTIFSSPSQNYLFDIMPIAQVRTMHLDITPGGTSSRVMPATTTTLARRPMESANSVIVSSANVSTVAKEDMDVEQSNRWEQLLPELGSAIIVGIYFVKNHSRKLAEASGSQSIFGLQRICAW